MSSALKLEPRWPEPARLTATSAFSRHMSASSASDRRIADPRAHDRTPRAADARRPPPDSVPTDAAARRPRRPRCPSPGPSGSSSTPPSICRRGRHQLVAPGDVVDVDLEDADVRDRRAPLRRDERREMAVVVVRRAVDLERLGEVGDLLRLVEAVPDHVDRGDVHRAGLEERAGSRGRVQVLAGADRHRRASPHERRARPGRRGRPRARAGRTAPSALGDAQHALGLEVEVEVDDRLARRPRCLPRTRRAAHERLGDLAGADRAAARAEAGHQHLRLVAGNDDVRLEGRGSPRSTTSRPSAATSSYDASFVVPVTSHARARVVPQCDQ